MFKEDKTIYDVVVVGGGSAGMFVAGRTAELGLKTVLLEKNKRLGEKLRLTGGGRCNITNAEFDIRALLDNYGSAKDFLFSPFSQFGIQSTFDFFEKNGLPLVIEARKRAFPKTQKAEDVVLVLEKYLKKNGVVIKTNLPVSKIIVRKEKICGVEAGGIEYRAKIVVLATGGLSHTETGSTGDGMRWLSKLGHTVRQPSPTVVPLAVREKWVKDLSGVSLSFMKISFYLNKQKVFSKTGKLLFTHFGLSGPLIMNLAGKVKELLAKGEVTATLDVFPNTDLGTLDKDLVKIFNANKNKDLKNIFGEFVPGGTDKTIFTLLAVDENLKVHSVPKELRKEIARLLKNLPITIEGLMGYDRAIVSDGGISLLELEMKTMQSKKHPNLFVIGDLLDVNRQSGGFSLQLCWTTAFVAGQAIAKMIKKDI